MPNAQQIKQAQPELRLFYACFYVNRQHFLNSFVNAAGGWYIRKINVLIAKLYHAL